MINLKQIGTATFLSLTFLVTTFAQENQELTQILNNLQVELVQPGTISTNGFEFGTSISPDSKELFFVKGISGFRRTVLVYSTWQDGYWSKPKIAPFSGQYRDGNPYHAKDGKGLYFTSSRPTSNPELGATNLWFVARNDQGWSEPELVKGAVNDKHEIVYPTVQADKTIHFVSWSRPGSKGGDIFVSKYENGTYTSPELVDELNTPASDADPEISPDGNYLYLTSQREGGLGHYDLYIFKKQKDGKWGKGINLGPKINSRNMDSDPILSPDGQTLYFSSDKLGEIAAGQDKFTEYDTLVESLDQIHNGLMNIYKVDLSSLLSYLDRS
ncbi:hypothetical protein M3P19_02315 [Muricauda sp. 2012CJ35-5]|uniref:WD40-like Beta Propeller Repeat n=1 Tax=Flagellimonas spongiicola TaxID=2942208 RepID=A0ABT0PNK5_9FLAO|nr:hypothetical protein [Allomuricauda spongiicola]MCL6272821.1 hypothetical protein [Allomuricauda spongiicola]